MVLASERRRLDALLSAIQGTRPHTDLSALNDEQQALYQNWQQGLTEHVADCADPADAYAAGLRGNVPMLRGDVARALLGQFAITHDDSVATAADKYKRFLER